MRLRTANNHRRRAGFILLCRQRRVWASTGFFLYHGGSMPSPATPTPNEKA